MVEIVKPNPEAVKKIADAEIEKINATHAETRKLMAEIYQGQIEDIQDDANNSLAIEAKKVDAVDQKYGKLESDYEDQIKSTEAEIARLQRQRAAQKDNLKTVKTDHKVEKKSAKKAFNENAKDIRFTLERAIQGVKAAYTQGYNQDLDAANAEIGAQAAKVEAEKKALSAYNAYCLKETFWRTVNGIVAVGRGVKTIFIAGYNQSTNLEVPPELQSYVKTGEKPDITPKA